MLVPMKEMLVNAQKAGYGVGAFEFWSLESAQAVVRSAQKLGVPVILQNGDLEANHVGSFENMRKIAEMAAAEVDIPVALHLDHADSYEMVRRAVDAGYTSVMMDSSSLPYEENVANTCRVVELAHPLGITVESELGVLAGEECGYSREEAEAVQTSPDEAHRFVADTGIDALAVAIGTVHGFYRAEPRINIERLKQIRAAVDIPLVLHGGSGTPDAKVREAIQNGICKINICTEFVSAFGRAYTEVQQREGFKYNVPNLFTTGMLAGQELATRKLALFAGKEIK